MIFTLHLLDLTLPPPPCRPLADYQAYTEALGVHASSWDPSGQFLAVGSHDQVRRGGGRGGSTRVGE